VRYVIKLCPKADAQCDKLSTLISCLFTTLAMVKMLWWNRLSPEFGRKFQRVYRHFQRHPNFLTMQCTISGGKSLNEKMSSIH